MEDGEYFQWLRDNNQAIVAAVAQSPALPLSACPGWLARDLLTHVGGWYDGWYRYNIVCSPDNDDAEAAAASASAPPADPTEWAAYFIQAADKFLAVAESVDLDAPSWGLLGPQPARNWLRHVGQETTVHRWDVEHELDIAWDQPIERAVEALDDTLRYNLPLALAWGAPLPSGPLVVEATDASARWVARPADGTVIVDEGSTAGGRATLHAPVAELLLHLHGRVEWRPVPGSDRQVVSEWRSLVGLW
jgi:uncharacterized protein (TIGR03083 family)